MASTDDASCRRDQRSAVRALDLACHETAGAFEARTGMCANQTPKDEPQPQVVVAFGLRMTNWAPCSPSV